MSDITQEEKDRALNEMLKMDGSVQASFREHLKRDKPSRPEPDLPPSAEGFKSRDGKAWWVINGNYIPYAEFEGEPVCIALDCFNRKVSSTLIGLNFCDEHFGRFFSDDDTFKYGVAEDHDGAPVPETGESDG